VRVVGGFAVVVPRHSLTAVVVQVEDAGIETRVRQFLGKTPCFVEQVARPRCGLARNARVGVAERPVAVPQRTARRFDRYAEVEAAEGLAAETRAVPRGRLRVNAPVTFSVHALALRLPEYMATNSEVTVDLSLSNGYVDAIDEGFDIVFRIGELADSSLITRELAPCQLVLWAAPAYLERHPPIRTLTDLSKHECLGFSHTELRTHWIAIANAAMDIMLQPLELVRAKLNAGRLVKVLPEYSAPTRPMHILYAPDRRLTPKLRSLLILRWGGLGNR